eukprot:scaffold105800_cov19-Tisochrysis_lutea.AAC.1
MECWYDPGLVDMTSKWLELSSHPALLLALATTLAPAAPIASSKDRRHQHARPQQQRSAQPALQTSLLEPVQAAEPPEKGCSRPGKVDSPLTSQHPTLLVQQQQQQENLGSHALAAVCLSEDSSDNDGSTSADTGLQQGNAYPPAGRPAMHRRVPVRVHRGSSSSGKQASSSEIRHAASPAAAAAQAPVAAAARAGSAAQSALKKRDAKGEAGGHAGGASHDPHDGARASKTRTAGAASYLVLPEAVLFKVPVHLVHCSSRMPC